MLLLVGYLFGLDGLHCRLPSSFGLDLYIRRSIRKRLHCLARRSIGSEYTARYRYRIDISFAEALRKLCNNSRTGGRRRFL